MSGIRNLIFGSLGRPVSKILSANIVAQFLGLGTTLLSATVLGVSEFGQLTAILLWASFVSQAVGLGLPDTMVATSRIHEQIKPIYRDGFFATSFAGMVGGFVMMLAGALGVLHFSAVVSSASSLLVLLTLVAGCISSIEQRLSNFGAYNRLLVASNLIGLLLLLALLVDPSIRTLGFVLWARVIGLALPVCMGLIRRRDYLIGMPGRGLWSLLRKSLGYHLTGLLNAFGSRGDQLVASILLPNFQLGILGLIVPFIQAVKSLPNALSTVSLVNVVQEPDSQERIRLTRTVRRQAIVGGSGMAAFGAVACLILIFLQGEFNSVGTMSMSVVFTVLIYMTGAAVGGVIDLTIRLHRGSDIVAPGIIARTLTALFSVILSCILVESWGLVGSGTAFAFSGVVGFVVLIVLETKMFARKGLA